MRTITTFHPNNLTPSLVFRRVRVAQSKIYVRCSVDYCLSVHFSEQVLCLSYDLRLLITHGISSNLLSCTASINFSNICLSSLSKWSKTTQCWNQLFEHMSFQVWLNEVKQHKFTKKEHSIIMNIALPNKINGMCVTTTSPRKYH